MTDNEIIKALECCCSPKVNACDDCPFYERCYENNEWLEKEAIDLINRQKAEIERLKSPCEMQIEVSKKLENTIKADAIKEFAVRLNKKLDKISLYYFYPDRVKEAVDYVKNKMLGVVETWEFIKTPEEMVGAESG